MWSLWESAWCSWPPHTPYLFRFPPPTCTHTHTHSQDYLEKSKYIMDQLSEVKLQMEGLKVEDRLTHNDRLHETNVRRGNYKRIAIDKVRGKLSWCGTQVLDSIFTCDSHPLSFQSKTGPPKTRIAFYEELWPMCHMDSCTHCRSNNLHSGVILIVLLYMLTAVYMYILPFMGTCYWYLWSHSSVVKRWLHSLWSCMWPYAITSINYGIYSGVSSWHRYTITIS